MHAAAQPNLPAERPGLPALVDRAPEPGRVAEAVAQLRGLAVRLDDLARAHPDDWQGLTYLRAVLKVVIGDLRDVERTVEHLQAGAMPSRYADVEGVGRIERGRADEWRNWQAESLAHLVAMMAVTDPDTGAEVELAPRVLAMRVADELMACARFSWRLTALRERGIDPEDYAHHRKGRPTVRMPRMEG